MGYRQDMELCRQYIEEHLAEEITPRALAQLVGYSFFHFCHVFRSINEMAVCEYLRERRLVKAATDLAQGKRVTDIALDSGYQTLSGFSRAFTRRFGLSPSAYQKRKRGLIFMTPEIKKLAAFTAVGYILKPESEIDILENGAYWLGQDFTQVSQEDYQKLAVPNHGEIGAWMHPLEKTGELYYFFGPIAKDASFVPQGMEAVEVPAAEYAVFSVPVADNTKGLHQNIQKAWKFIFNDWFDGSGYQFDHRKMDFEYYLEDKVFIYVPIVAKA